MTEDATGGVRARAHAPVPAEAWAPPLSPLRLLADGRSSALLTRDATVLWWCAPVFDDDPLCWQLLDADGGRAGFSGFELVDADSHPAPVLTWTRLRRGAVVVEVRDALLPEGDGVVLLRLVRRCTPGASPVHVEHELRCGGFAAPEVDFTVSGGTATGVHRTGGRAVPLEVRADRHVVRDGVLHTSLSVTDAWSAVVVGVGVEAPSDVDALRRRAEQRAADDARLGSARLPRRHPERAVDALAVLRACTYEPTGAVVASPTTSLPEAPGHDRQFDYRYTWLRDASLSTAVAALLGQAQDARRYLDFVHAAWGDRALSTRPVLDVRGERVPDEREVDGVDGWAGSRPVRTGNDAGGQVQHDAAGLFVEAVSVYLQVGGKLDRRTWDLVKHLADGVTEHADEMPCSNGIWEVREQRPLVDGDLGRWLVLDRALWIARGWRPWTPRRRWHRARELVGARVLGALGDDGLLPQAYGQDPPTPDASSLMAVAFGLLGRDDPRAHRLVDAVLERLGTGPYLRRYPRTSEDGFAGHEGAFLPVSFLAVTALAALGRADEAEDRLDRLCARLPRLLSEEVDPLSDELLGNVPLVWTHAELARAVYVVDAARRRETWGVPGLWAWRLQRYVRLRHDLATD